MRTCTKCGSKVADHLGSCQSCGTFVEGALALSPPATPSPLTTSQPERLPVEHGSLRPVHPPAPSTSDNIWRSLKAGALCGALCGGMFGFIMWSGFTYLVRVNWEQEATNLLFNMLVRCALVGAAIGAPLGLLVGWRARKLVPATARPGSRSGAATVEFAVLGPFMCVIFLGAVDLSRAYYYSTTIDNCAWNGAMWSSNALTDPYWNGSGNVATTNSVITACTVDGSNLNPPLDTSSSGNKNVTATTTTDADGNSIAKVTISYDFNTIGKYPGLPNPLKIVRTAQVRVVPGRGVD